MQKEKIVQKPVNFGRRDYSDKEMYIDSFRFYIMLGILTAEKFPEKVNDNIVSYSKQLLESGIPKQKVDSYIKQANATIPYEFNKNLAIENLLRK